MAKIGRPAAGDPVRPTTDDRIHIDIKRWKRDGRLVRGGMFITSAEGDPLYTVEVHVADDHLIIHHADTQQRVALDSTPCNFGGERPWFRCPECGRRAAILYGDKRFLCRLCHDLAWPVAREKELERAARALVRPEMRFVSIKTEAQQDVQALHRMRQRAVKMRVGLCNQIRGLVGEYGLVCAKSVASLRKAIPGWLEDGENGLSPLFRRLLSESYRQLLELDAHIEAYTREIERESRQSEACRRLQTIPGFGPVVASLFYSQVGDGSAFRRGRDVSASLGLVPRQHSSGGRDTLLGISKRGDGYLRGLLVHGARAVVSRAEGKEDRLSRWINRVRAERGVNKATVALANKLARIGWAVLATGTEYRPA